MRFRVAFLTLLTVICRAESLTGVLYSDHRGPSANAAVTVELASAGKVYAIYSGARMLGSFKHEVCSDIGAIWTVEFRREQDSSLVMTKADCEGKVDPIVHNAWLLVRNHLRTAPNIEATGPITARLRNSKAFREYLATIKRIDFSDYFRFGRDARCVDVIKVAVSGRVELATTADCSLTLDDLVTIHFEVIRNSSGAQQIDSIKLDLR